MQYNKKDDGSLEPLKQKNIDTGLGLERMARILQNVNFSPLNSCYGRSATSFSQLYRYGASFGYGFYIESVLLMPSQPKLFLFGFKGTHIKGSK